MLNVSGEPIKTGPNGEFVRQAAALVDDYNKQAGGLAVIMHQLLELRQKLNDDVGNGTVIVSGDGWLENALEAIPMLRMYNKNFPTVTLTGKSFLNARATQKRMHFEASDVSFCSPRQVAELVDSTASFMESEGKKRRSLTFTDAMTELTTGGREKSEGECLANESLQFQESERARGVIISIADAVTAIQRQRVVKS